MSQFRINFAAFPLQSAIDDFFLKKFEKKLTKATGLVIFAFIIFIVWLIRKRQIAQQELQKRLELQAKRYLKVIK